MATTVHVGVAEVVPTSAKIAQSKQTIDSNRVSLKSSSTPPSPSKELREITWQELAKHNQPHDAWIGLYGSVYDVTNWGKAHPGGKDVLNLAAGREATHIFESYHKMSSKSLLGSSQVPKVGKLVSTEFPLYTGESTFYVVLRKRVEEYFKKSGIKSVRALSTFNILNTIFIIGGMLLCYYLSGYQPDLSFGARVFFAALAGLFHHLSMVHLWHDISHYCYGDSPAVWRWFGWVGSFLTGHSMEIWRHRHVLGHHIYTNVCGVDPDLGIYKASPKTPIKPYKKKFIGNPVLFPTVLQPLLYSFIVVQMQLDDVRSYLDRSMEQMRMNHAPAWEFWIPNFIFLLYRIFLPAYFGEVSFGGALLLFLVTEIVAGNFFGYFSQISHISHDVEWPADKPIPRDWAELQVLTARDYSHESFFWTYLSGYLNYQVMHHLFPSVAPHFYPALLPILKETCKEFNIEYNIVNSFWQAVRDHWDHLKQFQSLRHRSKSYNRKTQ